jgi:hypothetical protein
MLDLATPYDVPCLQLDPERFLRAPRSVMESTMKLLEDEYGGAEAYMDKIGFTEADRKRLREALCGDD